MISFGDRDIIFKVKVLLKEHLLNSEYIFFKLDSIYHCDKLISGLDFGELDLTFKVSLVSRISFELVVFFFFQICISILQ